MDHHDYDIVIIGSGIGGLTPAIVLAKSGLKVLVLEKEEQAGGVCRTIERDQYQFNLSIHQIGGLHEKAFLNNFMKKCGIEREFEYYQFSEELHFPDCVIETRDKQSYIKWLLREFPAEEQEIKRLFRDLKCLTEELKRFDHTVKVLTPAKFPYMCQYLSKNLNEILETRFVSPKLKAILYALFDGYNTDHAFIIVAGYWGIFHHDFYYNVVGTIQCQIDEILKKYKYYGGEILYNHEVDKIDVVNHHATTIHCKNGEIFRGKYVISTADITDLFLNYIGREYFNKRLIEKIESEWKLTNSMFCVYLGLDTDLKEKYNCNNRAIFEGYSGLSMYEKLYHETDQLPEESWIWVGLAQNLDPTTAPPKKSTIVMGLPISFSLFNKWHYQDRERYIEQKEKVADFFIQKVTSNIPEIKNHQIFKEIITPISFWKKTGSRNGSYIGWTRNYKYISDYFNIKMKSPIQNLYISGKWLHSAGSYVTCIRHGVNVANLILKEYQLPDFEIDLFDFSMLPELDYEI